MNPDTHRNTAGRWLLAGFIALALFKLWLVSAQSIQALGFAAHDDRLFLRLTGKILSGHWLGNYEQLTLAKGPAYSLFAAVTFLMGMPITTAQHLLYIAACWLLVRAVRPWTASQLLQLALFAVLLFNPITYDTSAHTRVLRQNLTPAVSLFIMAALIALHARKDGPVKKLLPWALLLGVSLPFFVLIREDGIWLAPAVAIPWLVTTWQTLRRPLAGRLSRIWVTAGVPLGLYAAGLLTVSTLNWYYYDVFVTCEFRESNFKAAYGSLTRVKPATWHPFIPVARETRERIYAVSPAFVELREHLEGKLGSGWAFSSQKVTGQPQENLEIAGGWFMWALRDAITLAGHGKSGGEAKAFYARIAREVNDACDRGLLEAGPAHATFLPPWNPAYREPLFAALKRSAGLAGGFKNLKVNPQNSEGTPASLVLFADITHERLEPVADAPLPLFRTERLNAVRLSILGGIGRAYPLCMPWLLALSFIATAVGIVRTLTQKRLPYFGFLSVGLFGSVLALVIATALVDITSFPATHPIYLTGTYGFSILFVFTGAMALKESFKPSVAFKD